MNRTWIHFRRSLLALSFVGALGFGATQAVAAPEQARIATCSRSSGPTFDQTCDYDCKERGFDYGYCYAGYCVCRNITYP